MTREEYLQAYAPANAFRYAQHEQRCHTGFAPTLRDTAGLYGHEFAVGYICTVVSDFVAYTSASRGLSPEQLRQLSNIIILQYGGLKVTELLLFFIKCKSGVFGKFYSTIDTMDITAALCKWYAECNRIKGEHYYRTQQEERERALHVDGEERLTFQEAYDRGLFKNPETRKYIEKLLKAKGGN